MERYTISFAGAGRAGSSLCLELFRAGFIIDKIASETPVRGKELADSCGATWSENLIFPENTDVIIVAVPDNKLAGVLKSIICDSSTIVAHTAGSWGIDLFPENIRNRGVFYPLQTFSYGRQPDLREVPFFLEASDEKCLQVLEKLASAISENVYFAGTDKRRMLHLSAVFVCNFTNHLLTAGKELAVKAGFNFDILEPLVKETLSKALAAGPENSQTGPASRNDTETMHRHVEMLSSSPELRKIYEDISQSIINYQKK